MDNKKQKIIHSPIDLLKKKYILQELDKYIEDGDDRNAVELVKDHFRLRKAYEHRKCKS